MQKIVLKTGMANGKMVYLDEKGTVNPVLRGKVGETLEITVTSGEGAEHDIVFPELGVKSEKFTGKSGPVKLTVKPSAGKLTYYCSTGHRQIGMEGVLGERPADAPPPPSPLPRPRPSSAPAPTRSRPRRPTP